MIKFELEKPFYQKDIDNEIENIKNQVDENFSRNRKYGFMSLFLLLILVYLMDMDFSNKETGVYKFLLYLMISLFTFIMLAFPIFLKSDNIYSLYFKLYSIAPREMLHNCNAFIKMPGMEKYKEYVEKVRKQGRELTHIECEEIIKYWNTLI